MCCVRVFFQKNRPRFVGTEKQENLLQELGNLRILSVGSVGSVLGCICVGLRSLFLTNAGFCPPAEIQDYLQKMGL